MRKYRLAIASIAIVATVATFLYIFFGPATTLASLVAGLLQNILALTVIAILSLLTLLIGAVVVLTTDNEYIAAIASIALFLSIIVLVSVLPILINVATNTLNDFLSNITKKIIGS